ncbi:MAG: nucleotidyltransferase family protein [Pseudobdellovibrionaceae bacterium]
MVEPKGLSPEQREQIKLILNSYLHCKKQVSVFIFGSRAKGNFRKYSDLDLLIESEPQLSAIELSNLADSFNESDLPIKVDVVTLENCLNAYKESIEKEKVLWFTSTKN